MFLKSQKLSLSDPELDVKYWQTRKKNYLVFVKKKDHFIVFA